MPKGLRASFELVHEPPYGLVVRWQGAVGLSDLVRSTRAVGADPLFDGLRYKIYDCRDATGRHEPHEEGSIVDVAAQIIGESVTNPRIFRAWVGTDSTLSAMFTGIGSVAHMPIEQFDALSTAREWVQEQVLNSTGIHLALPS